MNFIFCGELQEKNAVFWSMKMCHLFPINSLPSAASDTSSAGISPSIKLNLKSTSCGFQGNSKRNMFTHEN